MNRESLVKPENFGFQHPSEESRLTVRLTSQKQKQPALQPTSPMLAKTFLPAEWPFYMTPCSASRCLWTTTILRQGEKVPDFLTFKEGHGPQDIKNEESARQGANQTHNSVREQNQGHHKIPCTPEEWIHFVNQTHNIHTIMLQNSQTIPEGTVKEDDNMMPSSGFLHEACETSFSRPTSIGSKDPSKYMTIIPGLKHNRKLIHIPRQWNQVQEEYNKICSSQWNLAQELCIQTVIGRCTMKRGSTTCCWEIWAKQLPAKGIASSNSSQVSVSSPYGS